MPIELGDARLTFLADTSQLDAAIARLQIDLPSKLKPSADAAVAVGKGFDQMGVSVTAAGASSTQAASNADSLAKKLIAEGVSAKDASSALQNLGFSQKEAAAAAGLTATAVTKQSAAASALGKGLQEAGTHGKAAGEAVAGGAHQATEALQKGVATAGLLSEAFNITLPRHVRTFIAELPALGIALEAAFNAAAIFFVVEAIISAGEKIEEFLEKPRKIAEAMRDVDDAAVLAERSLSEAFNASKAEQIGLTQGAVAKLDFELNHMASDADKVAAEIGKIGEALNKSLELQQTSKFDLLSFFLPNSREVTEEAKHFVTELQSTLIQSGNQAGLKLLDKELEDVRNQMAITAERFNADADKIGGALDNIDNASRAAAEVDKQRLLSLGQLSNGLEQYHKILLDGIRLDEQAKKAKAQQEVSEQAQKLAEEAKRDLDQEIANIALRRAAEHQAFADGITDAATWAVAQKNAVDATTAVQERYAARLVDIFQQSHSADELRVRTQEQAIKLIQDEGKAREDSAAAQEKYHTATLKIVKDWEDLQNRQVSKDFEAAQKSADELTRSELRLADAQAKLALTRIAQDFGPQEEAIKSLADFGIVTEEQKAQRLRLLYEQEENQAIAALRQLQAKEESAINAAQEKLEQKKASPFVTPAEVDAAEKYLGQVQQAYVKTQEEIERVTSDFEQKRIGVQRRAVAEAIALAQSEGHQKTASALLFKQSQLDEIDNEIRLARAHDLNTAALQKERAAIEAQVKALVQEVQGSTRLNQAIVELKTTMANAAKGELDAFGSAMAAAIAGQESFGAAMESGTLRVISSLAQQWAAFYFAMAIADIWWNPARAAGEFAAAVAFEAVAGLTSGLASKIDTSASNKGEGTTSSNTGTASAASQPEQTPVQTVNVQRFALGGLVNERTLALIGDARTGGGSQREAVAPVDDPAYKEAMWGFMADRLEGALRGGGTVTNIHNHIQGVISPHELNKVMKQMGRQVSQGKGRLVVNTSFRNAKRG